MLMGGYKLQVFLGASPGTNGQLAERARGGERIGGNQERLRTPIG